MIAHDKMRSSVQVLGSTGGQCYLEQSNPMALYKQYMNIARRWWSVVALSLGGWF